MLEEIGENNDANFHLKLNKIDDHDYKKAFDCLRRHLQTIECVLTKMCNRYRLEIISAVSISRCGLYLCSDLQFCRFAELIEATFTNIFLISVNLNMIGGSITGIHVCINRYAPFCNK